MAIDYSQYQSRVKPKPITQQEEFERKQSLPRKIDISKKQDVKKRFFVNRSKLEARPTETPMMETMAKYNPMFKTQLNIAQYAEKKIGDKATRDAIRRSEIGPDTKDPKVRVTAMGARGLRAAGSGLKYGIIEPAKEVGRFVAGGGLIPAAYKGYQSYKKKREDYAEAGKDFSVRQEFEQMGQQTGRGITAVEAESPGAGAGLALGLIAPEAGQFALSRFLASRRATQLTAKLKNKPVTKATTKELQKSSTDLSTDFLISTREIRSVKMTGRSKIKDENFVSKGEVLLELGPEKRELSSELKSSERIGLIGQKKIREKKILSTQKEDLPQAVYSLDDSQPTLRKELVTESEKAVIQPIEKKDLSRLIEEGKVQNVDRNNIQSSTKALVRRKVQTSRLEPSDTEFVYAQDIFEGPATQAELRTRPERFEEFRGQVVELQDGPDGFAQRRGPGTKAKSDTILLEDLQTTITAEERAALPGYIEETFTISSPEYEGIGMRARIFTSVKPIVKDVSFITKKPSVSQVILSEVIPKDSVKKSNIQTAQDVIETQEPRGTEVGGTDQVVLQELETPKVEAVTATKTEQSFKEQLNQKDKLSSGQQEQQLFGEEKIKSSAKEKQTYVFKEKVKDKTTLDERAASKSRDKFADADSTKVFEKTGVTYSFINAVKLDDLITSRDKLKDQEKIRDDEIIIIKPTSLGDTIVDTTQIREPTSVNRDIRSSPDPLVRDTIDKRDDDDSRRKNNEGSSSPYEDEDELGPRKRKIFEFTITNYIFNPAKRFAGNIKRFFGGGI